MSRRPRTSAPEPMVNGLQSTITETGDAGPDRFVLECPTCGEVGRFRFLLLARRAFEEHADEEHSAAASPLEQIRTLVDLAETSPGVWQGEVGAGTYLVRQRDRDRYEVEVVGHRATIDARMSTLDDARVVIGGHAGLVSAALATAAAIELRHVAPANVVALE
ncbi:hypothetical protein [Streptomyces sp. NPDC059949]|uniref:hypothetical protein n=1 Tax=Streptomyces sp. NPDC059949 TaxID=3347013 RepID=UPI0036502CAC